MLEENGRSSAVIGIALRPAPPANERHDAIVALADGRIFSVFFTLHGSIRVLAQVDLLNVLPAAVHFMPGEQDALVFNRNDGEMYVYL